MINITQTPESATFEPTHYVFVEKHGPFMETAQKAWHELHAVAPSIKGVRGAMALYKMGPQIYRAGFLVGEEPKELPPGINYEHFAGGKYNKFTLTGSYSQLPEASGFVYKQVQPEREDWSIEYYVNDPFRTPESELKTEIYVPA